MTLSQTPEGTIQGQQADLADHIKFFGTSGHGKSMLGRLTEAERRDWWPWAKAHTDVNGMDWPGWVGVRAREDASKSVEEAHTITPIVSDELAGRALKPSVLVRVSA